MDRNHQDNDPSRDRSSRIDRVAEDMGGENTDLGHQQSEGNLGNERTRSRDDEGDRSDRSPERTDRSERNDL